MKFNWMLFVAISAVLIILFVLLPKKDAKGGKGMWTVYGNNHCGWTRKQKDMMDSKGIPYKYVDCEVENCPGITGYPTLTNDDGEVKVGYTPM
jgi:hypothetical protein